jgi:transcriptional regulator with XRE-family HTH domain
MDLAPGWERRWVLQNASRLADLRVERRISRKQLADEAGLNISQISRAEAGRDIRLSTLLKICAGLGYCLDFDLQELSEEAGELPADESRRREERRDDGLLKGKRWR